MSFKEEYDEYQRKIAPDEEFLERLAEKMDNEKEIKKKSKARRRGLIFSAAAVCAAAAALMVIVNITRGPVGNSDIISVGADKFDYQEGLFSGTVSSMNGVTPKELAEILSAEETTVYGSENTTFDFDDRLDENQKRELAQSIAEAKETSAEPEGVIMHYMAVSSEGGVVKFAVSENVLEIGGSRYEV